MTQTSSNSPDFCERIRDELREKGIDLEALSGAEIDSSRVKVVCVAAGLGDTLKELGKATRDQVVMVRIDEETSKTLDAWVETGAVKSRSEAAALFIREGLKVRAGEIEQLADGLKSVEDAKKRLREKAREVFEARPDET